MGFLWKNARNSRKVKSSETDFLNFGGDHAEKSDGENRTFTFSIKMYAIPKEMYAKTRKTFTFSLI